MMSRFSGSRFRHLDGEQVNPVMHPDARPVEEHVGPVGASFEMDERPFAWLFTGLYLKVLK